MICLKWKAVEDFEQVTDEKVCKFYKANYNINISKKEYLAMSEQEKRLKISNYYSNM